MVQLSGRRADGSDGHTKSEYYRRGDVWYAMQQGVSCSAIGGAARFMGRLVGSALHKESRRSRSCDRAVALLLDPFFFLSNISFSGSDGATSLAATSELEVSSLSTFSSPTGVAGPKTPRFCELQKYLP
jgi:hypothetical protein